MHLFVIYQKEVCMKIMITFLGVLTILAGILPLLGSVGIMSNIAITKAPGYYFVITAIGIIGLLYGMFNSLLFGFEKFATISLGILTLLGGMLPFLQNFMNLPIPVSGLVYSIIIILIGILGMIYGFVALG